MRWNERLKRNERSFARVDWEHEIGPGFGADVFNILLLKFDSMVPSHFAETNGLPSLMNVAVCEGRVQFVAADVD